MEEEEQRLQERDGGFRVQLNSRDNETSYSSSRRSSLSELMMSSRNSCGSGEYHHGLNTKTAARNKEGDQRRPPAARRCLSEEYDMKRHVDQAVEIFPAHDKLGRLLENPTPQRMGKLSTKTKISYPCKKNWLSNNRPVQKQAAQIRSAAAREGWISRWNAAPCVRRSSSSRRDLPMSTTSIAWHRHKQLGETELPQSSSSRRATTVAGSMPILFNKKEACALAPEKANALSSSSSSYGLSLRSKYSSHAADAAHGDAANTRQRQRRSERGIDDSEQRRRGANDGRFFCDSSSSSSSRSSRSQDDDFSTKWEQEIAALQAMIARTSTLLARGSNSKPTTGDGDRQQLRISGRGFSKETATSELMMTGTKVGDHEEPENNLSSFSRRLQQQGFESAAADDQSSCILLASSTLPKQGPDATGEETEIRSRDQIGLWESEPSTPSSSSSDRQYFSPAGSQQEIEEVEVWDDNDDDDDEHELHLEDESLAAPCSKEDEEDDDKSFSSIGTVRTLETSGSSSASSNDFPAERFNLRSTNCMQLNYRNSCKEEEDTAVIDEADYDYDHDLDDAAVPGDWEVVEMSRDVDHRITRSAHSSCRYYNSRYLENEDLQHYSDTSRTTNDSDDDLSTEEEHDEHNQHWHLGDKHINLMNPMYCLQLAGSFDVPASSTRPTTRDFATKELAETAEAAARFEWEEEEEAHDRLKLDDDDYNMVVIRRRTANVKIHNSSTATANSSVTNLCVQQQQQQQLQAQHSFSMYESAWAESYSSMAQDDDISFATPSNTSSFHGNKCSSENNSKSAWQHSSQTNCNNRLINTTTTTMTISLNGSSSISSQLHIKSCLDEAGSNSCKEEKGSPTNSCSSSSTSPICEHEFPCMICELANNVHAAATTKSYCNNLKFFRPQQQQQLHLGECSVAEETLNHQSCNHSDIVEKQMWHLGDHVHLYPGWHQTPPQQQQHHCTTPQNFFGSEHPTTLHGAPSVVLRKMLMSPNYYYSDSGGAIFITTHDSQIKFLVVSLLLCPYINNSLLTLTCICLSVYHSS